MRAGLRSLRHPREWTAADWAAAGLAAAVAAMAVVGAAIGLPYFTRAAESNDFIAYYEAARFLNEGASPYTGCCYIYPPFFAAIFRPLAGVAQAGASVAFYAFNLCCLAVVSAFAARLARARPRYIGPIALALILLPGTQTTLQFGQVNLILAALVIAAFWVLAERPGPRGQWLAGACLGVACMIKLYPAVLAWTFVARRQWRGLAGMAVALASTAAIGLAFGGGLDETARFVRDTLPVVSQGFPHFANQSFMGVLERALMETAQDLRVQQAIGRADLMDVAFRMAPIVAWPAAFPLLPQALSVLVGLATAAALVAGLRRTRGALPVEADFAALTLAALMISPVVWDNYHVLLVIPFVAAYRAGWLARRPAQAAWLAGLALVFVHRFARTLARLTESAWVGGFGLLGVLVLWIAVMAVVLRGEVAAAEPSESG